MVVFIIICVRHIKVNANISTFFLNNAGVRVKRKTVPVQGTAFFLYISKLNYFMMFFREMKKLDFG